MIMEETRRRSYTIIEPRFTWSQSEDCDILTVDASGFKEEQLRVSANTCRKLKISGERHLDGNRWVRFVEEFRIPKSCHIKGIKAEFNKEDQMLHIILPKSTRQAKSQNQPTQVSKPPMDHKTSEKTDSIDSQARKATDEKNLEGTSEVALQNAEGSIKGEQETLPIENEGDSEKREEELTKENERDSRKREEEFTKENERDSRKRDEEFTKENERDSRKRDEEFTKENERDSRKREEEFTKENERDSRKREEEFTKENERDSRKRDEEFTKENERDSRKRDEELTKENETWQEANELKKPRKWWCGLLRWFNKIKPFVLYVVVPILIIVGVESYLM